jgi:hypothetical protein
MSVCAQETRIAKLLVSLRTRLGPFMAGEVEAFREVQVGRGGHVAGCLWLQHCGQRVGICSSKGGYLSRKR